MWTSASRGRVAEIAKKTKRYPTDLTDEEWERMRPFLPKPGKRGRKLATDLREVLNAIRYMASLIYVAHLSETKNEQLQAGAEKRDASLSRVEHDSAAFRKKAAKLAAENANTRTQAEKFEDAARELGCDPDEDRFRDVLRKLTRRPPS